MAATGCARGKIDINGACPYKLERGLRRAFSWTNTRQTPENRYKNAPSASTQAIQDAAPAMSPLEIMFIAVRRG